MTQTLAATLMGLILWYPTMSSAETAVLADKGTHYEVVLTFEKGVTHRQVGEAYGRAILKTLPDFEAIVDSYLSEIARNDDGTYREFLRRTAAIRPQVPAEYRQEIEGLASRFSGKSANVRGDGKISVDEAFFLNLIPDVARGCQCNALAVYGPRSKTKDTLVERTLDWKDGSTHQAARLQAVVTIRHGRESVCLVGYLGFLGVVSGFNSHGLFAAILDSPTGRPYAAEGRHSYPMDLRRALESGKAMTDVAAAMTAPANHYTFSHLIFLADPAGAGVIENDVSGHRRLRRENSPTTGQLPWNIPHSLAAVNCFLIKGCTDNSHMYGINRPRWDSFKRELQAKGPVVDLAGLKQVAAFHTGATPGKQPNGDLYNSMTQQIIVFRPATRHLEVFFRPKKGPLPAVPTFENITVAF